MQSPRIKWLGAVAVCLVAGSLLSAETVDEDLMTRWREAVLKEAAEAKRNGNDRAALLIETSVPLDQLVGSLRESASRRDLDALRRNLAQIQSFLSSDDIQKVSTEIVNQVQEALAAQEQAYVESVDATINRAVEAGFNAGETEDLDPELVNLSELLGPESSSFRSDPARQSREKARAAVTFLCRWQDYLMYQNAGDHSHALTTLHDIARNSGDYPFVPRSKILDQISSLRGNEPSGDPDGGDGALVPSLEGKKLEDLASLRAETKRRIMADGRTDALREFYDDLDKLDRAYQEFQAGMVGAAFLFATDKGVTRRVDDEFVPLRQELLLKTLPIYLNTVETYPMNPGEGPDDYLLRIIKEARAAGDWMTVWKGLDAYRIVVFKSSKSPIWLGADIQSVKQFIAAQNLERAGEYVGAIRTYQTVVLQPGEYAPVDEAAERLIRLQEDHPEAYDAIDQAAR